MNISVFSDTLLGGSVSRGSPNGYAAVTKFLRVCREEKLDCACHRGKSASSMAFRVSIV